MLIILDIDPCLVTHLFDTLSDEMYVNFRSTPKGIYSLRVQCRVYE